MTGSPALPECTLGALRVGAFPVHLRAPFIREGARACARYLLAGGRLDHINEDRSVIQGGHLVLMPLPAPGKSTLPDRKTVALSLQHLAEEWSFLAPLPRQQLRFFLRFFRELHPRAQVRGPIVRNWMRLAEAERTYFLRARYHALLREGRTPGEPVAGAWRGESPMEPESLLRIVEVLRQNRAHTLNLSPRAEVWRDALMGEDVVIKYFPANPRAWRQWFGWSRARRGWAGNMILHEAGLPCPEPLGFAERLVHGRPREGVMIMRMLPDARSLQRYLVHRLPAMPDKQRVNLRHQIREVHLDLHRHGLYHKDIKALNLMVRETEETLRWWWIDLEDIRASIHPPFREVIRNFYQLNSSIPKRVTREERLAFAAGYRSRHPLASHPLVLRLIERKTRVRLERVTRPFSAERS